MNTVNCYFCQKEVLDRDAQNADPYNNDDGGSICQSCLEEKHATETMDDFLGRHCRVIEDELNRLSFDNGLPVSQKLVNEVQKNIREQIRKILD